MPGSKAPNLMPTNCSVLCTPTILLIFAYPNCLYLAYCARSSCCIVPAFPFSYRKIPVLRICPFCVLSFWEFSEKSVAALCRQIAPTPASLGVDSSSFQFSFLAQIKSLSKIGSFSSIQPFPSASYSARSAKPSPLFVPNSSEPSLITPSPFLSSAR